MTDWESCSAIERHPNVVSGAWVFRETRVPIRALFENLRDGATIDEFLQWFPGVTREQVMAVLDHEAQATGSRRKSTKILFDQGTPLPLKAHLVGHSVETAGDLGWAKLENGDLLLAAERDGFDLFILTDQNLKYPGGLQTRFAVAEFVRIQCVLRGSTLRTLTSSATLQFSC